MPFDSFGHAPVGEFGDDDRAINEQAHRHDQCEQHHHVDGDAEHGNGEYTQQEAAGNRNADQSGSTNAENADDDNKYQQHGGYDAVLKGGQHLLHVLRFIAGGDDIDACRPAGSFRLDERFDGVYRVDDIGAAALHDLYGERSLAVQPGDRFGILVCTANFCHVAEMDDAIADRLDRHLEHILGRFKNAGHLDRETAFTGMQRTGRNQPVVAIDQ